MELKEQLENIIDPNPDVDLGPGEWCFFHAKAEYGRPIEKVTTKKKPGIGVVVPVTKHLGVGIGRSKTKTSRKIVWDKTKCKLYLTNTRILISFKKKLVPIDLESLWNVQTSDDALVLTDFGGSQVFFMSKGDLRRFQEAWNLAREAKLQNLDLSTLNPVPQ
ncbi:MAG: hypothetical protein J5865_06025 [Lachnospiraceae bacterium]|nr:hypothetical protein [Lachnospiraceae bacterium]